VHTFFHVLAGDRVMGLMPWNVGSYASAMVLPEASLARIPGSLTLEQAAALPLAGLAAHQVSEPLATCCQHCQGMLLQQQCHQPMRSEIAPLSCHAGLSTCCRCPWQALDLARLLEGQRVLIHAGAGGVGSFAIQMAKAHGLHVTTTCSGRNAEFVREVSCVACTAFKAQVQHRECSQQH
jgi:NADPH:quinone reductase-like Zn-dependent oxidoreductase